MKSGKKCWLVSGREHIRKAESSDAESIWQIISEVIQKGDTYVFAPDSSREEMLAYWLGPDKHTYVALHDGAIVGTYILKDNQPGLGSHIANGSYMVASSARGMGVGRAMGEHSLTAARDLGYQALQFNIVIASNEPAVKLWTQLGFAIIGTVPEAFQHQQLGLVDAHIMYRKL